jgi:hypothetical protein
MAKSGATTVEGYLEELPEDRRAVVSAVRDVVRRNLPAGYQETMNWGMISYEVPWRAIPTPTTASRWPSPPWRRRRATTRST